MIQIYCPTSNALRKEIRKAHDPDESELLARHASNILATASQGYHGPFALGLGGIDVGSRGYDCGSSYAGIITLQQLTADSGPTAKEKGLE